MPFDVPSFLLGKQFGGGGGGSAWTKLAEQDFTVSTTSTTATDVGTISVPGLGDIVAAKNKIIYVSVRDKAGKRAGYCLGSDSFQIDAHLLGVYYRAIQIGQSVAVQSGTSMYGVFCAVMNGSSTEVAIKARYSASWSQTIDGTYHVEVYTLEWPDNVSPYA